MSLSRKLSNENDKKYGQTLIVLFLCFILTIQYIPSIDEVDAGTNVTQLEVQAIIDSINESLTIINSTMCYYNGTDGIPAEVTNYTETIIEFSIEFTYHFNRDLSNFTNYPDLLGWVYENLSTIEGEFLIFMDNMGTLDSQSQVVDGECEIALEYIDSQYDRENTTEEDLDNITAELLNDTTFLNLFDSFTAQLTSYVIMNDEFTDELLNITGDYSNCTQLLFSELAYRESQSPPSRSKSNSVVSINSTQSSSSSRGPVSAKKLLSHNELRHEDLGGKTAIFKAVAMDIDYIRFDCSWNSLDTNRPGRWLWDAYDNPADPEDNIWYDEIDPTLDWVEDADMQSLVVLKGYKVPSYRYSSIRTNYVNYWTNFMSGLSSQPPAPGWGSTLAHKQAALWASWSHQNRQISWSTQYDFFDEFLNEIRNGIATTDEDNDQKYDVVGFNIENEPNAWRPYKYNFNKILIPTGTKEKIGYKMCWVWWNGMPKLQLKVGIIKEATFKVYSLDKLVRDEVNYIKSKIKFDYYLKDAITLVNLHGFGGHWKKTQWKSLAKNNNLDVIAIDLYRSHLDTWIDIKDDMKTMKELSNKPKIDKPWWLIETEGADSANPFNRYPSTDNIEVLAKKADEKQAEVLGFYRLWGTYTGSDPNKAYNIYTNPGSHCQPRKDINNEFYWETIRDL